MCDTCVYVSPDGFSHWLGYSPSCFTYVANPSEKFLQDIRFEYLGPLDLDIPYV